MGLGALVALVAFVLANLVVGLASLFVWEEMVEKVNSRLPEKNRFDPVGWHYFKARRLIVSYHELFPEGRLARKAIVLSVIGFVVTAITASLLGFGMGSLLFLALGMAGSLWLMFRN